MAAYHAEYLTDLAKPSRVIQIPHQFAMGDNESHTFSVLVYDSDNPSCGLMAGTVSGIVVRPDGGSVILTGEKGEAAETVNLPDGTTVQATRCTITTLQACFAYAGQITVVIRLVDDETITAVFMGRGPVVPSLTDTPVDPGELIEDITTLIATANQAAEDAEDALEQASAIVSYAEQTGQTDAQKEQARTNIGAGSAADVADLKSAMHLGCVSISEYIQGMRNNTGAVSVYDSRCTTKTALTLNPGDSIAIKNVDSGTKVVVAGAANNAYVYDSGWKTGDFSYTVQSNTAGLYFVNIAKSDGSSQITPSDISTLEVIIKPKWINDTNDTLNHALLGSEDNITSSTATAICSKNFNNLPNNRIYGVSLASSAGVTNMPRAELSGMVITYGKYAARSNSDVQMVVAKDGNTWVRCYWSDSWQSWNPAGLHFVDDNSRQNFLETLSSGKLANIDENVIMLANGSYVSDEPDGFTGNFIFTNRRYSSNYNIQTAQKLDGTAYQRIVSRSDHSAYDIGWAPQIVPCVPFTTAFRTKLDRKIAKATGNISFWANSSSFDDTPVGSSCLVQNIQYLDNYKMQIAYPANQGDVFFRVVATDGTVYKPWSPLFRYQPLKVLVCGDSIAYGWRNGYKGFIGDTGYQYKNIAVSGATLSTIRTDVTPVCTQIENESGYSPDAVIASGGFNEYSRNTPMGTLSTVPVSSDAEAGNLDKATIIGALEFIFYQMIKKYPNAQRFFLITHKTYLTGSSTYMPTTDNTAGWNQQDLHDTIVSVCAVYGVRVIDVYKDSLINSKFSAYVSPTSYESDQSVTNQYHVDSDGIHPLALGYKEGYVPLVLEALKIATTK